MSGSARSELGPGTADGGPRPLLVVARWHPSAVDPGRGRFVADQVAALAATGRVAPAVVSFAFAPLGGTVEAQHRQRAAVPAGFAAALDRGASAFAPSGADRASGVPIARLPVARPMRKIRRSSDEADDAAAVTAVLAARLPGGFRGGIIHAHTGSPDGFAALSFARAFGWPLVITEHASFLERQLADPLELARYRAAVARAAAVVAVSRTLATLLESALPELAGRVRVIPNVVDLETFVPADPVARRPDELLFVGGRIERKGIDVLIPAFARARAARPGLRLRMVGRAPTAELEDRWRAMAAAHGVTDGVVFEGQASREGVAAAMREATALVLPSRHETFGVVAAESLASGLPVVASAIPALEETLGPAPESVGALAPPGDVAGLADAIVDVCARAAAGHLPPDRLRAAVAERFGSAVVTSRLLDLYDELAPRRGPARTPATTGVASRSDAAGAAPPTAAAPTSWPPRTVTGVGGRGVILALDRGAAAGVLAGLPSSLRARVVLVTRAEPAAVALPAGFAEVVLRPAASDDPPTGLGPSYRPAGLPAWNRMARRALAVRERLRERLGWERRRADGEMRRDLAAVRTGLAAAARADRPAQGSGDESASAGPIPLIAGLGGHDSEVLAALPVGTAEVVAGGPLHLLDVLAAGQEGSAATGPDRPPPARSATLSRS